MLRIIFKTKDAFAYVPDEGISVREFLVRKKVFGGKDLSQSTKNGAVQNLFSTLTPSQLSTLIIRAKTAESRYQPPNFFSYYYIECGREIDPLQSLFDLLENQQVEWAYLDPGFSMSPNSRSERNPLANYQGYLYNAPLGIGAGYAWKKKGGKGDSTVKFVDIEQGWLLEHECLEIKQLPTTGKNHEEFSDHGAGVMGIIMMRDSNSGGIGITPFTKGYMMSQFRSDGILNTPDAILSALPYLESGDILLLESQVKDQEDGYRLWPLEAREASFDMIRLATVLGITVIEPCGNGNAGSSSGNNLDDYTNLTGERIFNRNNQNFRDSGAIMVAAATSDPIHERMYYSNYGNRIDCYAWGEHILTAGMHPNSSGMAINTYTNQFGGSSGAAAIIAGVAISLQSMMEANHQCRLNPGQMREILGNPQYGTNSADGIDEDKIGVMPDLEKITRDFVDNYPGKEAVKPVNRETNTKLKVSEQYL